VIDRAVELAVHGKVELGLSGPIPARVDAAARPACTGARRPGEGEGRATERVCQCA
jgi:hypothetical protein